MKKTNIDKFPRGWLVGSFDEAFFKADTEFGIKFFKEGDKLPSHHHKKTYEITVIVSGKHKINNTVYSFGDVILIEPMDETDYTCIESGGMAIFRSGSGEYDKY